MSTTRKFLRLPAVIEATGWSRATIWRKVKAGILPAVVLGNRCRPSFGKHLDSRKWKGPVKYTDRPLLFPIASYPFPP
jgi:hypothetical protein